MQRVRLYHYLRSLRITLFSPEVRVLLALVLAVLGVGTLFYHFVEGWGWIDSFYFSAITLATVGYGDFTPKTAIGKLFTVAYIAVGFGLVAAFLTTVATQALEHSTQSRKPDLE